MASAAAVLAYCHAHPYAVALAVTAALSFAHDYLARFPRLQAVAKLAAGLGFDMPKITAAAVQALTGKPPAAKPSFPPVALPCLTLVLALMGCSAGAAQTTAAVAEQADVAAYAAQEQSCVQNASTLAAADACIAAVQAYWCGDGGALAGHCAGQSSVDAGGQ